MKEENKISTPMAIVVAGFLVMIGLMVGKMPVKNNVDNADSVYNKTGQNQEFALDEVSTKDHIRGDINEAEIVIVEYSDTECPFCKDFHNIMKNTMGKYEGKIAWVYRHFPLDNLHTKARMEAEATECAASLGGNDAFWRYLDMIFETTNSNDSLDLGMLPLFAEKIGINVDEFNACVSNGKFKSVVQDHLESGTRAGATGTPYSVIITKDGTQIPLPGANDKKLFEILDTILGN